ncbi:EamA family transporter [Tepidiforma flava]|uniref:EamA family transporter n=1 Tax=Tepidiforma flava TaxID=3004094 RepID=A0ABY7M2T5_9CHLR|nr:EamA family transporter [Tepidiforma flava]WBL34964.1 EamA family transporter [Tepidiforma flava]
MGELAALLAALTWSATSVALTSLSARTSPVVLSGLRLGFGALAMPLILLASGETGTIGQAPAATLIQVVASGALGYGLGDTLYIAALNRLGMQRHLPRLDGPLHRPHRRLRRPPPRRAVSTWGLPIGALLIGAGTWFIIAPAPPNEPAPPPSPDAGPVALAPPVRLPPPGLAGYALLGGVGVTWAAATLWLAAASGDLGAIAAGTIRTPAGAVALLGFAFAFQRPALLAPFRSRAHLGAIAALAGLVGTTIGSLLYVYAVVTAGAARTAILSCPRRRSCALPLSIVFLGERLTRRHPCWNLALRHWYRRSSSCERRETPRSRAPAQHRPPLRLRHLHRRVRARRGRPRPPRHHHRTGRSPRHRHRRARRHPRPARPGPHVPPPRSTPMPACSSSSRPTAAPASGCGIPISRSISPTSASDFAVLEVRRGTPLDETVLSPSHPYRYVLEVNAGWFEAHGLGLRRPGLIFPPGLLEGPEP